MSLLDHRRSKAELVFLFKMIHGNCDGSVILEMIDFRVPRSSISVLPPGSRASMKKYFPYRGYVIIAIVLEYITKMCRNVN